MIERKIMKLKDIRAIEAAEAAKLRLVPFVEKDEDCDFVAPQLPDDSDAGLLAQKVAKKKRVAEGQARVQRMKAELEQLYLLRSRGYEIIRVCELDEFGHLVEDTCDADQLFELLQQDINIRPTERYAQDTDLFIVPDYTDGKWNTRRACYQSERTLAHLNRDVIDNSDFGRKRTPWSPDLINELKDATHGNKEVVCGSDSTSGADDWILYKQRGRFDVLDENKDALTKEDYAAIKFRRFGK